MHPSNKLQARDAAWSAPDGAGCSRHAVDALGGEGGAAHCDRVVSEAANWIGFDWAKCQLGSAPSAVCPKLWLSYELRQGFESSCAALPQRWLLQAPMAKQ